MHWTTLPIFLTPLLAPITSAQALKTTRILTKFTPNCPDPSQTPGPHDLNEEFTVAMNIRPGTCQGIPVPIPLGYVSEVDHVSVALSIEGNAQHKASSELSTRDAERANLEVCTVRLFERPGCWGTPLIQREFGVGAGLGGESRCVQRDPVYYQLAEVFVRVDCGDGDAGDRAQGQTQTKETAPATGVFGGVLANGTAGWNGTRTAGGAVATPSSSGLVGRWQQRRLALVGR
ncbi:hypothetical protein BJX76DRAFT_108417 [Aspergillus varians]